MQLNDALQLARKLMNEHNLNEWHLILTKGKRQLGYCSSSKKTIAISKYLIEMNEEERVKQTILHEICHAIVGTIYGHKRVWKNKCYELGLTPSRLTQAETPKGKYVYECPNCQIQTSYHRRIKRKYACRKCCTKFNYGQFTEKYVLILKSEV